MTDQTPQKKSKKEKKKEAKTGQSLLNAENGMKKRYAISEMRQMWIVLKRALLFSRRDWVIISPRFEWSKN